MFDNAECELTSFESILGRIGRLYPCTLSNVMFRLAQHMNCLGYPTTERLMVYIYDLLCCVVLLCFAALKTWVICSWVFALGTVVFFLYYQLRLFLFLFVWLGACVFVLCLAPLYVCILDSSVVFCFPRALACYTLLSSCFCFGSSFYCWH